MYTELSEEEATGVDPDCRPWVSIAVIQQKGGREGFYHPRDYIAIIYGSHGWDPRREPMQRPWRSAAHWLVSLLNYIVQDYLTWGGRTTGCWVLPLHPSIKKMNRSPVCWERLLNVGSLSSREDSLCPADRTGTCRDIRGGFMTVNKDDKNEEPLASDLEGVGQAKKKKKKKAQKIK